MILWNKPSLQMMERTIDAATFRQKVISNNVANVDTPYFKRSDVVFEDLLQQELQTQTIEGYRTDPRHIPIGRKTTVSPEVMRDEKSLMNNNFNNVDIDYEMTLLAKNQLRYNVLMTQVNHDLKMFRTAINGGR
ncbi:flagellar basal body rod protein FlgB [Paenibacillus koleovorans]|uniref:flagellar basal body rod protein FlgB n=1 Tax=Paenibacillus koleovorans TaxID=121608 RepID=UPI000FDBBA48|nr:flagellar basal body rod protein FlgB [Paenibacillus koleovorans]